MKNLLSKLISWFAHRGSVTVTMELEKCYTFRYGVYINGTLQSVSMEYDNSKNRFDMVVQSIHNPLWMDNFPKRYRSTGNKILKETIIKK